MKANFVFRICLSLLIPATIYADSRQDGLFPFVLPWDDSEPGIVNLSEWLPKPAGKYGHVRAGGDGHLYTSDERIRFFGVDLSFSANFPCHEDAEKVAARLAKFGINIVRFHIMDMRHFPDGIFDRNAKDTRKFDDEALDRLDYFTDQLNRNGIYVNLCLLNYRPFCEADGLPRKIEDAGGSPYQSRHVVGFFDTQILNLQKEYAQKLLTHRNVYTGKTYSENPAVAFVEINNENGLIHAWLGNRVDELPELFRNELTRQWNKWLLHRYGTTEKLSKVWNAGVEPLGSEIVANGCFTHELEGWKLEKHEGAEIEAAVVSEKPDNTSSVKSARLDVNQPGKQDWHVRFQHAGVNLTATGSYTLTFQAKADKTCTAHVSVEQTHPPWHAVIGRIKVDLTSDWKQFRFVTSVPEAEQNARIVFDPAVRKGTYWLTGVSLKPGGVCGLGSSERMEEGTVPLFAKSLFGERSATAQLDWMQFLWETEENYWQAMYKYLKQDLKVQSLIIGTVTGCSTPVLMSEMDCIDSHAYWQHPIFPGRPWDSSNWIVPNKTMVNDRGGVLPELALRRVLGKPFCVTEYGNPAPNTFVGEGHLLKAAYAALQDWDYISTSRYSHSDKWGECRFINYFDINQHPVKMATLIPAAAMFLRGDVCSAHKLVAAPLDKTKEIDLLRNSHAWKLVSGKDIGIANGAALLHRVAIDVNGDSKTQETIAPDEVSVNDNRFVSDTGELDWDLRNEDHGVVTVNSSKSRAVIGYGGDKRYDLNGVVIEPGATRQDGWSVITVTAMEGDLLKPPCRILVTATGLAENTDMGWKNAERNTVGTDWGKAPTLVEGIPARITLPVPLSSVTVWSLDERGQRKNSCTVSADTKGNAVISIGPECHTIWYEVEVK